MVEIVFRPPVAILLVALGVVVVGIVAAFMKKGESGRKVTSIVIVLAVAGGMLVFLYRATTLTVDAAGLEVSGTISADLDWADVDVVVLERNLGGSEFRPTVRTRGASAGSYRSGRFTLANGASAQVLMERTDQAAVLVAGDLTHVFAPAEIDVLFDALREYAPDLIRE